MRPRSILLGAYALSGLAGLVYEVAWGRMLALQLGHTVAAVSTVLATYMGGLASGAWLGGRLAPRLSRRSSLQAYGGLELAVAACALLLPPALGALRPLLAWAYAEGAAGPVFGLVRILLSSALLAVPTVAMGATFPLAVRWFDARDGGGRNPAGVLYAANSAGAAAGAALTGFLFLPALGLFRTTLVGAALNAAAAALALWLSRDTPVSEVPETDHARPAAGPERARRRSSPKHAPAVATGASVLSAAWRMRLAAAAVAASGFVALAHEVAWTRALAPIVGPTSYAFSAVLAAVIAGIAIGSALGTPLAGRIRQPAVALGWAVALAAAGALPAAAIVGRLPLVVARLVADPGASFASVVSLQSLIVVALLLPMSLASGAAFPLALALASGARGEAPRRAAAVYAANTLGAIAGAFAGGFGLLPVLGLQATILAVGIAGTAAGLAVVVAADRRRPTLVGASAFGLAAAGFLMVPRWDPQMLSAGAYKYAPFYRGADVSSELVAGSLLYYREGAAGTVAVRRTAGVTTLAIDGKVDASNGGDMLTQKLLAHLPLLMHLRPSRVAIIGLGSGVTLGAALRHPVERAVVLEISPEVVEASTFFSAENRRATSDPRTRLIVGDGRSHMLLASEEYDVIISEPSNPWMAGVAPLFSREFFQAARARLAPGGLVCQWAHTYDISAADLRSIVATFGSVFPKSTMWLVGGGDLLLVGGLDEVAPRLEGLRTAWGRPGVAEDLAEVGIARPFSLLSLAVGGPEALRAFAAGARLETDAAGTLEFSAPRAIYGTLATDNAAQLRALSQAVPLPAAAARALASATAADWSDRGRMQLDAEAPDLAYEDFARALAIDPNEPRALAGLARAAGAANRLAEAIGLLGNLAAANPGSAAIRTRLSNLLAAHGQPAEAVGAAEEAVRLAPADETALAQLASVFADAGDAPRLAGVVDRLAEQAPQSAPRHYYQATLHALRGEWTLAAAAAERALARGPADARTLNLLGVARANAGDAGEARGAFEAAVRADPRDATGYVNLGLAALGAGDAGLAAGFFREALTLEPRSAQALGGLADALDQAGDARAAARLRRLAAR